MSIIELQNVYYSYFSRSEQIDALRDISCRFERGKIYAVVGKSGSGKSTLLSLMAGLDKPKAGKILLDGEDVANIGLTRYRREKAAVIYQNFRLFPLLTVQENIAYPMELRGLRGQIVSDRVRELIRKVNLPESTLNRFPGNLSGGEQQRVAIARALAMDVRLLLADEPTGNLDSENSATIIEILSRLAHDEQYCVIVATHDLDVIEKLDEGLRIVDGCVMVPATCVLVPGTKTQVTISDSVSRSDRVCPHR